MKSFKKYSYLFSLLSLLMMGHIVCHSETVSAQDIEYKNMEQMLGAIRLEKKQIESMIDKMMTSGRLTQDEGIEAKRSIASVKEDDFEMMKSKMLAEAKTKK